MSQAVTRTYSVFGKQIMKHMIDKNMTAKQLADAIGTTPQYVNKIIHGERSGGKYIGAIKDVLDIVM